MGNRGATRPKMHSSQKQNSDKESKENTSMEMTHADRLHMLKIHHHKTLWVYWFIVMLGIWMMVSPFTFSYSTGIVNPSGGRELWLSLEQRIFLMKWSDILSGALLLFFGWRTLTPNRPVSVWICCFVGVWLSIAPLLFWAPTAVGYLNDTLVGMLIISLTILIPGMPNMIMYMKMGSEVPKGWSYNPSSWPQRWIMIVLGLAGYLVSRYLAAFQMGYASEIWDPIWGKGSELVLNSKMSHDLFISDGGLGALAYTFEFLMGFMGSPSRWRTMPWMVTLFGILVIPLGLVHIFLVISQPVIVGHWCFFCIMAAGIMLPMLPLEVDEVIAMGQHMVQATRRGEKFWKVFWKGGEPAEQNEDKRSPDVMQLPQKPMEVFKASVWGMSAPWQLLVCMFLGIVLMIIPALSGLPVKGGVADVNHLGGALIVVCSVLAMGEVIRTVRFVNFLPALALAALPWFYEDAPIGIKIADAVVAVLVIILSIPKGRIKETYGDWDRFVR